MKSHTIIQNTGMAVLIILMLSCFAQTATAQGNLVVNGGFDTDSSGWTTNVSSGYYEPLKGDPAGCFTLYGSISQTVNSLTPGFSYFVSGIYDVDGEGVGGPASLAVAINGVSLDNIRPRNYPWQSFSFIYTATSSSVVLSLTGTRAPFRIDDIAMYAVPEPNSLCLMGVGGMMSALFFRHRRKARRESNSTRRPRTVS
jgi:hypothetical protein